MMIVLDIFLFHDLQKYKQFAMQCDCIITIGKKSGGERLAKRASAGR